MCCNRYFYIKLTTLPSDSNPYKFRDYAMCVLLVLTQSFFGNAFKIAQMLHYMKSLKKCPLSIIIFPQALL